MKDNQMFKDLIKYQDKEFYEQHPYNKDSNRRKRKQLRNNICF